MPTPPFTCNVTANGSGELYWLSTEWIDGNGASCPNPLQVPPGMQQPIRFKLLLDGGTDLTDVQFPSVSGSAVGNFTYFPLSAAAWPTLPTWFEYQGGGDLEFFLADAWQSEMPWPYQFRIFVIATSPILGRIVIKSDDPSIINKNP